MADEITLKRIIAMTDEASGVNDGQYLLTDSDSGSKKLQASKMLANEAPAFDSTQAYSAGDYVRYDGGLYRFTADHAAGAWTGSDASAVTIGGELSDLKADLEHLEPGLSEEAKAALLACFEHVAWTGDDGQDYYDALEEALYAGSQYITVRFTPGNDVFFTDDSLDILKPYLVVTYHDGAETAIVSSSNYTLSGTLTVGQNTITVIYQTHSATFTVSAIANVASAFTNYVHPTAAASGTYEISNGVFNVKCASQSAVDSWWTWIADEKSVYWSDVYEKTIYCRVKVKKTGTADADAFINWYVSMFSSDNVTSMNANTRRFHIIDNAFTLTTEYVTRTASVVAIPENFTNGDVVPDSNTKVGMLIFIRSLDTVNFAEIKMGVV